MSKDNHSAWVDAVFKAVLALLVLIWIAFPPQGLVGNARMVSSGAAPAMSTPLLVSRP
jgi:hypothetical protein